jgi:hypothetical protein
VALDMTGFVLPCESNGSVYTARKVPTAMIFVRCKDGISHHPAEYSSPEDLYLKFCAELTQCNRGTSLIRSRPEIRRSPPQAT